jgi:hypothetical protein
VSIGILASSAAAGSGGGATWTPLSLQFTWVDFGSTYAPAAHTQNGDYTWIRGLIKSGPTSAGTTLATGAPATSAKIICFAIGSVANASTLEVNSSGNIVANSGVSAFYQSLQMAYVDSGTSLTSPTLGSSWANFGSGYEGAGYVKDSGGNVHLQGLIKSGTTTAGTVLFTLPSGSRPQSDIMLPVAANNSYGSIDVQSDGDVVVRVASSTWTSLSGVVFPTTTSWSAPSLGNSWVDYGGAFAGAGYYKDGSGVVHLRGLVKDGTTTQGTVIFTLPVGSRPAYDLIFPVPSSGGSDSYGAVDIKSSGDVWIRGLAGSTYLSLSGISFPSA